MSKFDVNDGENKSQNDTNTTNDNVGNAQKVVVAAGPCCCANYKRFAAVESVYRVIWKGKKYFYCVKTLFKVEMKRIFFAL
jgi:3-deoxy-D-arabino-heptulosonate 7-phosphate (DAHP) synthase